MIRPVLLATALTAASLQAQTITITVDAAKDRQAINPAIYGVAFATGVQLRELNVPLNRWGGNSSTRYNWQLNASNHAQDYFFESIGGDDAEAFIINTRAAGAEPMIAVPMIGWVARLGPNGEKLASFSVAKYGPQQQTDPFMPDAGNGIKPNGEPISGNDPHDANVAVDSL